MRYLGRERLDVVKIRRDNVPMETPTHGGRSLPTLEGITIMARVDSDKHQDRDSALWCELQWRIHSIVADAQFRAISADQMGHDCGRSPDSCRRTRSAILGRQDQDYPGPFLTHRFEGH